jgi:hypothetical protein
VDSTPSNFLVAVKKGQTLRSGPVNQRNDNSGIVQIPEYVFLTFEAQEWFPAGASLFE